MSVSRKNKSMKKSYKSRKNIKNIKSIKSIKNIRKSRKNIKKMRGAALNNAVMKVVSSNYAENGSTKGFNEYIDYCVNYDEYIDKSQLLCATIMPNLIMPNTDLSYILNDKVCNTIENLSFNNNQLNKSNMETISEFLIKTKKLKVLGLENCYNKNDIYCFINFMNALGENTTLERIDLSNNVNFLCIKDEGEEDNDEVVLHILNFYYMYINIQKHKKLTHIMITNSGLKNYTKSMMLYVLVKKMFFMVIKIMNRINRNNKKNNKSLGITQDIKKNLYPLLKELEQIFYARDEIYDARDSMQDNMEGYKQKIRDNADKTLKFFDENILLYVKNIVENIINQPESTNNSNTNIQNNNKSAPNFLKLKRDPMDTRDFEFHMNNCTNPESTDNLTENCFLVNPNKLMPDIDLSYILNDQVCNKLETLSLNNNPIDEKNMTIISQFLIKTTKLKVLELKECYNVNDIDCFIEFMKALGNNTTLEKIDLSDNLAFLYSNEKFLYKDDEEIKEEIKEGYVGYILKLYWMYVNINKNNTLQTIILNREYLFPEQVFIEGVQEDSKTSILHYLILGMIIQIENIIELGDNKDLKTNKEIAFWEKIDFTEEKAVKLNELLGVFKKIQFSQHKNRFQYFNKHILTYVKNIFKNLLKRNFGIVLTANNSISRPTQNINGKSFNITTEMSTDNN